MNAPTPLEMAIAQIQFARQYTLTMLEGLRDDDWFAMPGGAPTHLAWQVGHVAMAEYGLCLFRLRGRAPIDAELMSSSFRKLFSRGSTVERDPSVYPSVEEIRGTFDRVYEQVCLELPAFPAEQLAELVEMPYAGYPNKLGALLFASHHEMLHAGQMGVLRRLLGYEPVR